MCNVDEEIASENLVPQPRSRFLDYYIAQNPIHASVNDKKPSSSKDSDSLELTKIEEKTQEVS